MTSAARQTGPARSVRVYGQLAAGRPGARSDADLAWETQLLQHLDHRALTVPVPIPRRAAGWRRVADTLRQLHRLTRGWPQRPGWRSSTDHLHAGTGTKVDLGAMPAEGVARCRGAWARLAGRASSTGDPNNPGNVRMTAERVALIDWDEAHVDVPGPGLVLPRNAVYLNDFTCSTN
jgi:Ser/Thr protein kinase RdoA (MazF antagonist)